MFEEYAAIIRQRYPQISIYGANYPPPKVNSVVASVINIGKWITLAAVVFGEKVQIWRMLNVVPPAAYTWSQENKVVSCLTVFFLSNTAENALLQTGAFEVEFNGIPIWSKLKAGRIPQGEELFEVLNNQLRLSAGKQKVVDFSKPPPQYNPNEMPSHQQYNPSNEAPSHQQFGNSKDKKLHKDDSTTRDEFAEFDTETRDNSSPVETGNKDEYDEANAEFDEFDNEERSEL